MDLGFTPGLSAPPATETVWLPKGTYFPVHTMQSYSSYGAGVGSKLRFELSQDVIVKGYLIAMAGDTAEGTVQNAMTASKIPFMGRGGDLRVSVDKVYSYCGDTIAVDFDRSEYRRARDGAILGVISMFTEGDILITRGQQYLAFSDRPQRVCAARTAVVDPPVPAALKALGTTTQ
jgi:hypothetical protein